MDLSRVKALAFDVFGTVVDYRGTIIHEGEQINQEKGLTIDWGNVTNAWRGRYRPFMDKVRYGELPWMNLDALHRLALEEVFVEFGITNLNEEEKAHLNRVWHRLQPWPDAIPGLTRLRRRFMLATLSNGNVALLANMAKYSGLPWDVILSAELARAYKPDPQVYQMAADLLGLRVDEVMMVAAHWDDLRAAQGMGLKAAYIPRPLEFGLFRMPDLPSGQSFEVVATDFIDLASQLEGVGPNDWD